MSEQLPAPSELRRDAEQSFAEPWHAQVFAITLTLHERGLFSWPEWVQALGARITAARVAGDGDQDDACYHHWLTALEQILTAKGVSSAEQLEHVRDAWRRAAERTPHGQPIELDTTDFHNPDLSGSARTWDGSIER